MKGCAEYIRSQQPGPNVVPDDEIITAGYNGWRADEKATESSKSAYALDDL
jgi:hypothetical protein